MTVPRALILPVFLAVIFVGAMVFGPVIYFGLGVVWPVPFHRAMDRALLISAVAALGLFGSRIPLGQLWPWNADAWKQLLLGYLIAAVSIQAMIGFYLAAVGFTCADLGAGKVAGRVVLALVAALLAPPLEETVFRGFLQRELGERLGWRSGWMIAALIFMAAHFLKIPVELDHEPVHWWSGVTGLGAAFANMGHDLARPENIGKAANLFLVGLILGGIFLRAGTLWLNAGLHSGWIFGLLLFTGLTKPLPQVYTAWIGDPSIPPQPPTAPGFLAWMGGDILSSPVTTLVLLLLGFWIWRFYRHPSIQPEPLPGTGLSVD